MFILTYPLICVRIYLKMKIPKEIKPFLKINIYEALFYRGPVLVWIAGSTVSFFVFAFIWLSASMKTGAEFTKAELVSYYFFGIIIQHLCGWYTFHAVNEQIKKGSIINYILKPISFYWYRFGSEIGWHAISGFLSILVSGILFIFFKNYLSFQFAFSKLILFLPALVLLTLLIFQIQLCLGLAAFWKFILANLIIGKSLLVICLPFFGFLFF